MGLLRLFLAVAVLLGHTTPILGYFGLPAHVAVRSFFIISGFYIAMILADKYKTEFATFWFARALRLYPLYWLSVFLAILVTPGFFSGFYGIPLWQEVLLRLPNITILGAEVPFLIHYDSVEGWLFTYGISSPGNPEAVRASGQMIAVGPAWSLGLELWFYIAAPFLCRLSTKVVAMITLTSFLLFLSMEASLPWTTYFFFPANLWLFGLGVLAFRVYKSEFASSMISKLPRRTIVSLAVAILALIFVRQYVPHFRNYELYVYGMLALTLPILFAATRMNAIDRTIGDLSYPLYITHAPVLALARDLSGSYVAIGLCLLVAIACWFFIDRPIESWRQREVSRRLTNKSAEEQRGTSSHVAS